MARRRRLSSRLWVITLALLAGALAGCHDEAPRPPPGPVAPQQEDPRPNEPPHAAPSGPNPLPFPTLTAAVNGSTAVFIVGLDGDTGPIYAYSLDFGDSNDPLAGAGAPASRYSYTYAPPTDFRQPPAEHTVTLTLSSNAGHVRATTVAVTIDPPPNSLPGATLLPDRTQGHMPLDVVFTIGGSDADGTIQSWTLDFGDGSEPVRGTQRPGRGVPHEYRIIGNHTAVLTLEDDAGAAGVHALTLSVWTPKGTRTWTLDDKADLLMQHDGNGTVLMTEALRRPRCGTGTTCEDAVGLASTGRLMHLAVARPMANGTVWTYNGLTGKKVNEVDVAFAPHALWSNGRDGTWTTHRASGIVAHIPAGADRARFIGTPLGDGATKMMALSGDGANAWVTARETPALLVQIGAETGQALTVPLPLAGRPALIEYSNAHRTLVVVSDTGDVVLAEPSLYGPVVRSVLPSRAAAGSHPFSLECPTGAGTCWIAFGPTEQGNGRLVGVPLRSTALDGAAGEPGPLVEVPGRLVPVSVHAADGSLIVGIGTAYSPDRGYLIVDASLGTITHQTVHQEPGGGPRVGTAHPGFPGLFYLDDPARGGWQVLDLTSGEIVHRSTASSALADAIMVIAGR